MRKKEKPMRTFGKEGIQFSDQYFSEENIAWLMQPPEEMRAEAMRAKPHKKPPVVKRTLESAYDVGWKEMLKDPKLRKAVEQAGVTQENGFANYVKAIAAPMPANADEKLAESLKVDYVTKVEDGKYVHRLNGEVILSIPIDATSAKEISRNADATICFIFVVIDLFLIVLAVAGVVAATVDKAGLVEPLMTPLQGILVNIDGNVLLNLLNKTCITKDTLEILAGATELIYFIILELDDITIGTVVEKILSSWSGWEIGLAIASVIACILAIIGTAGASVLAKLLGLLGSVMSFILDLIELVQALGYTPPEPPSKLDPPDDVFRGYYIGNSNTLEVHNLFDVTPKCLFDEIKEDHKVKFDSFEDVYKAFGDKGYNGCAHCMSEYDTG